MLQLAGRIGLGVDIGQFLQLERPFERHREAGPASEIEHVLGLRQVVGELLDRALGLQRLGDETRHRNQLRHQRLPLSRRQGAAGQSGGDCQAGQDGQLAGERLRRRNADLRSRQRRRDDMAFPCD